MGTEYNNKKVLNFCKENGIEKTFSPPRNPQNNGIAERFNYTLISCAKTLLSWSKMSTDFWDYAVKYANLLYNITPHKGIDNKIPNELYYHKKVNLKYIKVFGCVAYYKNFSQNKLKFDSNAIKGAFVGFNMESNSYMIMDTKEYNIHLVREAVFRGLSNGIQKEIHPINLLNNDNYIFELPIINEKEVIDEDYVTDNTKYHEASTSSSYNKEDNSISSGPTNEHNKSEKSTKESIPENSAQNNNPSTISNNNPIYTTAKQSRKGKEPMIDDMNHQFLSNLNDNYYGNTIEELTNDLQTISVSQNNIAPSCEDHNDVNLNPSSKSKSHTEMEVNSKIITISNEQSLGINPLKHKIKDLKSSNNKKLKYSFNNSLKRPRATFKYGALQK